MLASLVLLLPGNGNFKKMGEMYFFKKESHKGKTPLKLTIKLRMALNFCSSLPPPPECWDSSPVPPLSEFHACQASTLPIELCDSPSGLLYWNHNYRSVISLIVWVACILHSCVTCTSRVCFVFLVCGMAMMLLRTSRFDIVFAELEV